MDAPEQKPEPTARRAGHEGACPNWHHIGRFAMRAEPEQVARFRTALGAAKAQPASAPALVPATFPLTWLTAPEVLSAIVATAIPGTPQDEILPLHLEQELHLGGALTTGAGYLLDVCINGPDSRATLQVKATVEDETGTTLVHMTSTLVLCPADPAGP